MHCGCWQVGVQVLLGPTKGSLVHVMDSEPYCHAAAVGDGFVLGAGATRPEAGCSGGLLAMGTTPSMGERLDVVVDVQNH